MKAAGLVIEMTEKPLRSKGHDVNATKTLTTALQKQVLLLEDDLRERVEGDATTRGKWTIEHARATSRGRTDASWPAWRDDRVTQVAVAWVLATVFVRFCEDNGLVHPIWIVGPGARRQEALDAENAFYRERSRQGDVTAREWLLEAIGHLIALPATKALVDDHSPLWLASPSGDAATKLLAFWRQRSEDGVLVHDLEDARLDTRFLGDLYQDLSEHAKDLYALLQTPVFVEEFILDQTLEPALADRPLEGFRMIDPTCGSGHFLLGGFARLLDRLHRAAPGLEAQARVQTALDSIYGVDLNPFAVAIARFRLTVAALTACGLSSLESAPAFRMNLAIGDSLLHGSGQQTLRGDADLSKFAYASEDLGVLQITLLDGQYDAVVGNPPYITVRDRVLNQAYRDRFASCKGKYALTVPFMERFFGLATAGNGDRPAGWIGQITSNSFMKREFGSKLIEEFLAHKDLRLVADTSGAYIPGHGTPTVILVGRNQGPIGPTTRAVLGVRGEPGRPDNPAKGIVWTSIVEHVDEPGWNDGWVTVADFPRSRLDLHPWSLAGGVSSEVQQTIEGSGRTPLGAVVRRVGFFGIMGSDPAMLVPSRVVARKQLEEFATQSFVRGEDVRDFGLESHMACWFPYDDGHVLHEECYSGNWKQHLWPTKVDLSNRPTFTGGTYLSDGRPWFEWHQLPKDQRASRCAIVYSNVATHNQFVFSRGGYALSPHASVIKLPASTTEDEHLALMGVLNSSAACFWLKQNSQKKAGALMGGGTSAQSWTHIFEFSGTTLLDFPLPKDFPLARARLLDALAQQRSAKSANGMAELEVPTGPGLAAVRAESDRLRSQMLAIQEELDWEVYRLYGLISDDLTYAGNDLPGLARGERAFEVHLARQAAAGVVDTTWFTHPQQSSVPVLDLPPRWPVAYRDLVKRRLALIEMDPVVALLERPDYKRRWASEPWEKRQFDALRDWLLTRLEDRRFWSDLQGRPTPRSVGQLADEVGRDPDLVGVLALWEGRPDLAITKSLVRLFADEAVPYLAAFRYKEPGLRKREAWEATWALQRREDAGEQVGTVSVPPKYTSADYSKATYWQARGKLDVPKERFILYPDAGRDTDPTPVLGWAGWNHAEQALALNRIIADREAEGRDDSRLIPLVAGLAELQPWVEQWHSGMDPAQSVDLAQLCREELSTRAAQVGRTLEQLREWRPEPVSRGRRPRSAGAS